MATCPLSLGGGRGCDLQSLCEEHVGAAEVAVDDGEGVHVCHGGGDAARDGEAVRVGEGAALLEEEGVQVALLAELKDHAELHGAGVAAIMMEGGEVADHALEGDDVGMVQADEDVELEVDVADGLLQVAGVLHRPAVEEVGVLRQGELLLTAGKAWMRWCVRAWVTRLIATSCPLYTALWMDPKAPFPITLPNSIPVNQPCGLMVLVNLSMLRITFASSSANPCIRAQ